MIKPQRMKYDRQFVKWTFHQDFPGVIKFCDQKFKEVCLRGVYVGARKIIPAYGTVLVDIEGGRIVGEI